MKLVATAGLTALSGCWSRDTSTPTPSASHTPTARGTPPSESPAVTSQTEVTETPTPAFLRGPGVDAVDEVVRSEWADRFDSFVNVAAAGGDQSGGAPIDDVLASAVDDDTLVFFPEGEYSGRSVDIPDLRNVGLVSPQGLETTLTPAAPASESGPDFLKLHRVRNLLLDGFDFDFRQAGYGGITQVHALGDFTVRNVRVRGPMPGS